VAGVHSGTGTVALQRGFSRRCVSRPQRRYRRTLDSPSSTVGTLAGNRPRAGVRRYGHPPRFLAPRITGVLGLCRPAIRWTATQAHPQATQAERTPRPCSPVNRLRPGPAFVPTSDDPGAPPQTPALPRRVGTEPDSRAERAPAGYQSSSRPSTDTPPLTDSLRPGRSDDARSTREPPGNTYGRRERRPLDDPPRPSRRR
jgi:hypothetical protein